jgi:hypothetical protein
MPGSDELFHQGKPIAPPMFDFKQKGAPTRGGMTDGEPTPEEMGKQFDALLHNKHVNLKDVCVEIFDLRVGDDREKYCNLYKELYAKVQARTVLLRGIEKKFVESTSTWLVYIEWWEYALEVDGKEVTPEEYDAIKKADSPLNQRDGSPPEGEQGDNNEGEDG